MEDENIDPAEDSVYIVKHLDVNLGTSLCNSTLSCNNIAFLLSDSGSSSTDLDGSNNSQNVAKCKTIDLTSNASTEKRIDLELTHYPPLENEYSVRDASRYEAEALSVEWMGDESIDSQVLFDKLKSLGSNPGPITTTTKKYYQQQLIRLCIEEVDQAAHVEEEEEKEEKEKYSKELNKIVLYYPGREKDIKPATLLDRLMVKYFSCPDLLTSCREGNITKLITYFEKFNSEICFFPPLFRVTRHNRSGEKIFYLSSARPVVHSESTTRRNPGPKEIVQAFFIQHFLHR
jgi:hypothetical protein